MALLEFAEVSKRFFGDHGDLLTFDRLDFVVHAGEVVGIVGPSGCGKTTILRLAAGLDFPSSGSVHFNERPVTGPSHERGLLFQSYSVFPWLHVSANIAFSLKLLGLPRKERHDRAGDLIRLVGLEGFEGYYPHQLSGGMQQRVALARLLAARPSILLLDEPFGALDALTRSRMQDVLQDLIHAHRLTALLVTHDIEEALYLCDVVHVLSARPARLVRTWRVPYARPRAHRLKVESEFCRWREEIGQALGQQ